MIIEVESGSSTLSAFRGFIVVETRDGATSKIPITRVSVVIVRGYGGVVSVPLLERLANHGIPLIVCGKKQTPVSITLPCAKNLRRGQVEERIWGMAQSLRRRYWREIVIAKIKTQAQILSWAGKPSKPVLKMTGKVRVGDKTNAEARAAATYWRLLFGCDFRRNRATGGLNAMLNYGYTVLRAVTARNIACAGLPLGFTLNHISRGNPMRLADDLMEPYRAWVDGLVFGLHLNGLATLSTEAKKALARLPDLVTVGKQGKKCETVTGSIQSVCNNLVKQRKLDFPETLRGGNGGYEWVEKYVDAGAV